MFIHVHMPGSGNTQYNHRTCNPGPSLRMSMGKALNRGPTPDELARVKARYNGARILVVGRLYEVYDKNSQRIDVKPVGDAE